jgi:D-amino-acid oxidase
VPVAVTGVYLAWLRARTAAAGVRFALRRFASVAEIRPDADAVVVAAGLGSAALLGDDEQAYPIRGQVVRLANPGLTDWISDDDDPAGVTYVIPRDEDVVCGGTDDVGDWDEAVRP